MTENELPKEYPPTPPARQWEFAELDGDDNPIEEDPSVERGERLHTSKVIARGGKSNGKVPGATEE